jgi:hypothetical protein
MATTMHTWIFSLWLRAIDEQASDADFSSGSRNAPSSRVYSMSPWKCGRGTKDPSSSISIWAIARLLTFPATTKVSRRRFGWAEIYRTDLWTTGFREYNIMYRDSESCTSRHAAYPPIVREKKLARFADATESL